MHASTEQRTLWALWYRRKFQRRKPEGEVPPGDTETLTGLQADLKGAGESLEPTLRDLVARGWVVALPDDRWDLTETGAVEALRTYLELSASYFSDWMIRLTESPSYAELCRVAYQSDFAQFGMMTQAQFEHLWPALAVGAGDRVLDVGCGIGTVTAHVAQQTGASVHGVDFAEEALAWAREHFAELAVSFERAELDTWTPPEGAYDAIMAIDTLYFADDLERLVRVCLESLRPGGRFVALYSGRDPSGSQPIDPAATKLGRVLTALGVPFVTTRLGDEERGLWQRYVDHLRGVEAGFERDGVGDLYRGRVEEGERNLEAYEKGLTGRFLYRVVRD